MNEADTSYFLPYQEAWINDDSPLKVAEKSRRVGFTYASSYRMFQKCMRRGKGFTTSFIASRGAMTEPRSKWLIVAPSRAGWYRFLGRMREDEAAQTIISVETSKRIAQGIQSAEIDYRLAADMMTALSIDAAAKGNGEAAKILGVTAAKYAKAALGEEKLKLDAARQKTADEQLKLAREKFEAAERRENAAKATVADNKLSDEERMAKLREIYGI